MRQGVRKRKFATALSRGPKIKRKPRGKPFEKGNMFSLPYRFPKGVSGNPGGRPKTKKINESARKQLAADIHNPPPIETEADAVVAAQLYKAKKGDPVAAAFIADRAEGRPAVTDPTDGKPDTLVLILEEMAATHQREFGPPQQQPALGGEVTPDE
jgi:Family of unknown function (DUF5681)